MSKEIYTVGWIMEKEKFLKLEEPKTTYFIADNVFELIKKNNLLKNENFKAEIEIRETGEEHDEIIFLKAVDDSTKTETKEDTKTTDTSESENLTVKELTVAGVSVNNKGVTFKEEEKVWYTLDDSIDPQTFKDTCTKKTVEVSIRTTEKGNDVIVSFTCKAEDTTETSTDTQKSESTQGKNQYNTAGKSIEAQASLKCAKVIVASMVDKDSKPEFVLKLITKIAKHSHQVLQDLKNKE